MAICSRLLLSLMVESDPMVGRRSAHIASSAKSGAAAWARFILPCAPTASFANSRHQAGQTRHGHGFYPAPFSQRAADSRHARSPEYRAPVRRRHDRDGLPYFVMEYIEGGRSIITATNETFEHRRTTETFLADLPCRRITRTSNHVIHRDIKPSNILVTRGRHAEASGLRHRQAFGSGSGSRNRLTQTATAMRLMTPEYASPEQVQRRASLRPRATSTLGRAALRAFDGHRPYQSSSSRAA